MTDVPRRPDISRATLDDWSVVRGWAADEGWNPGLADGPSFFAQDPDGFFLGRIDGEPVSAVSVVNYGAAYAFLGFYLVRPDLRGRGHGIATWTAGLAHAGGRTVGLDALAPAGEPVGIDVPLTNEAGVALAQARGLTAGFETARMYTGPVRPFAAHRVFGVTTLELG